ncbi:MAG: cysteine desulfurase [Candidatus Omnitrophota bacterium]|jgi:cysteine desulfurase
MSERIYLDYNATTPVDQRVIDAMSPFWAQTFANASSLHQHGQEAKYALEESRAQILRGMGLEQSDVYFTSGGTESNNLAILGVAQNYSTPQHIISTQIEHPSIMGPIDYLETQGWSVTRIAPSADGIVAPKDVVAAIRPETILIIMMHANNETGAIQPVGEVLDLIADKKIALHCDASQAIGKISLPTWYAQCHSITLSAHKLYGPKGVGALITQKQNQIKPFFYGGHQEKNIRPGTENIALIAGLAKACELITNTSDIRIEQQAALRDGLRDTLASSIKGVRIYTPLKSCLPNTLCLGFDDVDGTSLAMALDIDGICVSTGSACTAGSIDPSHVIMAMQVPEAQAKNAIRISLGRPTTESDIQKCAEAIQKTVKEIRQK